MSVAAAILGGGILSAGAQIFGASSAADAQTSAANRATDAQLAMFGITRAGLQPFITGGSKAANMLTGTPYQPEARQVWTKDGKTVTRKFGNNSGMLKKGGWTMTSAGSAAVKGTPGYLQNLIKPISMTQADLEATPGYKFTLSQGMKANENAAAARGLGASGAAIKGGDAFATGLSDATYNERFANALANKQFAFNSLLDTSRLGENAAAGLGSNATQTGGQIGGNIIGAGNATAGADIAGANAATGFGNSLVAAILQGQKAGQGSTPIGVYS